MAEIILLITLQEKNMKWYEGLFTTWELTGVSSTRSEGWDLPRLVCTSGRDFKRDLSYPTQQRLLTRERYIEV